MCLLSLRGDNMARKTDLGKLIKLASDAHEAYNSERNLKDWGTPKSVIEKRWYDELRQRHWDAVEGKVSFNPVELFRIRLLAHRYLRKFGRYGLLRII